MLPLGGSAWAAASDGGPKRLVVVMLRGAVDGLNVVVPYGEEAYYTARPTIAIAKPGTDNGGVALDDHFALHPALAGLTPLWQAKQLAFVHAAGSPDPTRSHFDAQLFIENGTPGRHATADGWMNRLLAALPGPHSPTSAVAVGPTLPEILRGRVAVANLPLGPAAGSALVIDRPEIAGVFDRLYVGNDPMARAWQQGRAARAELIAELPEPEAPAENGAPPPNNLLAQAKRLAGLISRDRNIRLAFLSLGGWDTHVRQGNDKGQLADRLRPFGDGLAAFAQALGRDWDDTIVVVLSEFGRTVKENGDGGTDHGHGNVVWVLGGGVRGGRVYGDWPGLAPAALYEGRDLAVTTDYRSVLAAVIGRHLRLPDRALTQIFPSFAPPHSDLDRIVA
ncbi:MAG TPA: DUF1501 domain-containing protein [Stellaceae bacterium]|jgi:uncharacterized protein (DUF1501 family)|nr:DUF1501 domain-containing protein [Stellaceae bacterium]